MLIINSMRGIRSLKGYRSGSVITEGKIGIAGKEIDGAGLYIFSPPVGIKGVYDELVQISPMGKRLEYRIRKSQDFPECCGRELIMLKLGRYEIVYSGSDIASMSVPYRQSFIILPCDEDELRQSLRYLVKRATDMGVGDMIESVREKLVDFLVEDYRTGRYTRKAKKILKEGLCSCLEEGVMISGRGGYVLF